jgi:predicted TIM-barrel fold metal-dependent hydrolase
MIGRQNAPHPYAPKTTEEIKRALLHAGVTTAIVYHAYSKEYHAWDGNLQLMKEISGDDFFKPVWVLLPDHTDEVPSVHELKSLISEAGVVGVRCFPSVAIHNFSLKEWCMGHIYELLESMQLPLYLDLDQTNWDEIHALLSDHPELPLVITNVGYRNTRYFAPLLRRYRQLHLEISMYKNFLGIESLVNQFGSEQFVYGTGMPLFSAGPSRHMVETADISLTDMENIAFRNSERLMEGIRYA